jgi:hypothetical protein
VGRAILLFLLVLGIVAGGLLLLRRTSNTPPPGDFRKRPDRDQYDDQNDDNSRGW